VVPSARVQSELAFVKSVKRVLPKAGSEGQVAGGCQYYSSALVRILTVGQRIAGSVSLTLDGLKC
jgi:hypothetical protein